MRENPPGNTLKTARQSGYIVRRVLVLPLSIYCYFQCSHPRGNERRMSYCIQNQGKIL